MRFLRLLAGVFISLHFVSVEFAQAARSLPVVDPAYYGMYSSERSAFHETILKSQIRGLKPAKLPRLLFVSGAFASGKSSLVSKAQGLNRETTIVVDSDVLRAQLPEWAALVKTDAPLAVEVTNRESGYLTEKLFWLALEKDFDVVFVSAHRDLEFTEQLLKQIHERFPDVARRIEWIHVENKAGVLSQRVGSRNSEQERQTDVARALHSSIQSRDVFRRVARTVWHAMEVDLSTGQPQVTQIYSRGVKTSVNGWLGADLRTVTPTMTREGYDIVLDIDWTLVAPLTHEERQGRDDVIHFRDHAYVVAPGAMQALAKIFAHSDVRLHAFSGGAVDRNRYLLSQMKTSPAAGGLSLLEMIESRGGQVWSNEHLTPYSEVGGLSERFRKRVEGLLLDVNPARLIMIDDQARFSDGWLRSIPSYGVFNDRVKFESSRVGLGKYEPTSEEMWQAERGRWYALASLVDEGISSDRSRRQPFRDFLLQRTQKLELGSLDWRQLVQKGQRLTSETSPERSGALVCRDLFRAAGF